MARTVFAGGRVFDPRSGEFGAADVAVADGRVLEVGLGLDGDEVIDAAGLAVLPGLFDCHVHLAFTRFDPARIHAEPFTLRFYEAIGNARLTLDLGITTVRDAGYTDAGVRLARERGLFAGPRMRVAVTMLSQTGGHNDPYSPCGWDVPMLVPYPGMPSGIVDGADAVRRKVREVIRAGADHIKVAVSGGVLSPVSDPRLPQLSQPELDVLVEEATAAGRHVMAHAHGTAGIKNAVRAGVRSIEHGTLLDDEAIALMVERGTWLVPTLIAPRGVIEAAEAGAALSEWQVQKCRDVMVTHEDSVRRAHAAGVRIAMGTDCPVSPHGRNLEELPAMAACGMSPAEVWRASTLSAAELMGLADELGSLEPGKRADVVLIEGDPADLSGLAGRIRGVWQDGVRVGPV